MTSAQGEKTKTSFKWFIAFLFKIYREQIIKIDLYLLGAVIYGIASPLLFRHLINDALEHESKMHVIAVLSGLFFGYMAAIFCLIRNRQLSSKMSATLIDRIRQRFYTVVQDFSDCQRDVTTGQLVTQTTMRLAALEDFLSHKASVIVYNGLLLFFGFIVLVYINPLLSLISFLCLVILFLLSNHEKLALDKLNKERIYLERTFSATIKESVKNQEEIKHLNIQDTYRQKVDALIEQLHKISERQSFKMELSVLFLHAGAQFLILLIFMMGCLLLWFHLISIGDLVGFILMFFPFSEALSELSLNFPAIISTAESIETLKRFISSDVSAQPKNVKEFKTFHDSFTIDQGQFSPSSVKFDLTLKKGQVFGVPNLSHAWVAELISIFSDRRTLYAGEISIDGHPISALDSLDYYEQIAVIGVTPCIFQGTLYYNLCLGKEVDPIAFDRVIKRLNLPSFIDSLPDRLNTVLPNEDLNLSAEQLMLIVLARMMLREPAVVILDQTLSAFDMVGSLAIKQMIVDFCQEKSRILLLVSNNLKHVFDLEKLIIVEPDGGVIIDSHDNLLIRNNFYKLSWSFQSALELSPGSRVMEMEPAYLRSIYLFRLIEDEGLLTQIANNLTVKRFQSNQVIFREGDHADEAFIIAYGLVSIQREERNTNEEVDFVPDSTKSALPELFEEKYRVKEIATLGIGDIFGEIALLNDIPRTASAVALTPCYLLTLNFQTFMDFYHKSPDAVREEINNLVTQRLTTLYQ
jgi:ATP-binding cassette, subfamily B, bacterial